MPVLDVIEAGARGRGGPGNPSPHRRHRHPHHHQQQRLCPPDGCPDPNVRVYSQACPPFVPLVGRAGWSIEVTCPPPRNTCARCWPKTWIPLVLGCTHYPLIKIRCCRMWSARTCGWWIRRSPSLSRLPRSLLNWASPTTANPSPPTATPSPTSLRFQTIGERFLGDRSGKDKVDSAVSNKNGGVGIGSRFCCSGSADQAFCLLPASSSPRQPARLSTRPSTKSRSDRRPRY